MEPPLTRSVALSHCALKNAQHVCALLELITLAVRMLVAVLQAVRCWGWPPQ